MAGRLWLVRDAVLVWLFKNTEEGNEHPTLSAADIAETVQWTTDALTEDDVQKASMWLREEGFLKGTATFGGGVPRPSITAKGERLVSDGRSVRDDPSSPAQSSFIVVHGSQGVTIANNSTNVTQTVNVEIRIDKAREVATALQSAAQGAGVPPTVASAANETAAEILQEIEQETPNLGRIKELLFKAGTAIAGTFGSQVGTGLAQQALEAAQLFG